MIAILSIRPEYADQIFDGRKQFEFRRTGFKYQVRRVVVYVTAPVSMVIGEFDVQETLCCELPVLWERTRHAAGISEGLFFSYFNGRESGYALRISATRRYDEPLCIQAHYGLHPPQSFVYLACTLPVRSASAN